MCNQTSRIESRRCVGRLLSECAHVRQAMNRGPHLVSGLPPWTIVRLWLHRLGFCATTCASCLLESSGQMHSALGLSIIYVHSRLKSLQLARNSTGCAEPCSLAVLVLHPGQQGRRYFRWTGHATSQDAASALTYHRILRCNSRCPQGPQPTEPRILAPMGCSHRCDRPAASLSTVRKGRPPLRAQTLIPQLQALLRGHLPAGHQHWGPFGCRSLDTDAM